MIRRGARPLLLGLALLDLLVFGAWITRQELGRRLGTEVRLPVEGYDPRDLLSGHYVRFRLVAAREAAMLDAGDQAGAARSRGRSVAYCLDRDQDGKARVSRRRGDGDDATCRLFIAAVFDRWGNLDFGVQRFYVDERRQHEAAGFTADHDHDTYLVARIDAAGTIHPTDLVVQGRSLHGRR